MSIIFKGNLTDHFTTDDYTVNQTSNVTLTQESYEHALMLEEFRQWLKRPIEVHAWYRTSRNFIIRYRSYRRMAED